MSLLCPKCHTDNADTAKFCKACGLNLMVPIDEMPALTAMQHMCEKCGTENTASAKFCKACGHRQGTPLVGSAPPFVAPPPIPTPTWTPPTAPAAAAAFPTQDALVAPIKPPTAPPPLPFNAFPAEPEASRSRWWLILLALLVVAGIGAAVYWYQFRDAGAPAENATTEMTPAPDVIVTEAVTAVTPTPEEEIQTEQADGAQATAVDMAPPMPASQTTVVEAPAPVPKPVPPPELAVSPPPVMAKPKPKPVPAPVPMAAPPVRLVPVAPAPAPVEQSGPSSPQEACGKRVFLALAMCMSQQCEKAQFTRHPQCVELREQNERRAKQADR